MAKTRVTKTHPPAGRPDWSGLPVMMEEPAIVAVDHPAPVAHKADSGIPQGRGLPGIGRDAAGAEEYFGDLPVTRSGRLAIHRLEHVLEAAPALRRTARVRRRGRTVQPSMQDGKGGGAGKE